GRALLRDPVAFLLDEPLSNLDAKLRAQMRTELVKLHRRVGRTIIHVTHDQVEAMTMGNRVAVLKDGDLMQVGTPLELYDHPKNVFVAQFIGTPPMNFFRAKLEDGGATLRAHSFSLPVAEKHRAATGPRNGQEVMVGMRPENVLGEGSAVRGATAQIPVEVEIVEPLGHEVIVHCRAGEDLIVAKLDPHHLPAMGEHLNLVVELEALHLFDPATEQRLTD
ncbi:MAG: TOBE domain-containing protein, partial [Acidobacteria bacterium]|nr:TOBE domain-containing protein [Acidobacteriota bacterium]